MFLSIQARMVWCVHLHCPIRIITQLLLPMNSPPPSPSRLPIQSLQNPFLQSINPQFPPSIPSYNFHDRNPLPPHQPISTHPSARNQQNLSENLNLADKKSFARNFKGRLYGVDQDEQNAKQIKQQQYRQQLLWQAEEDRRRKKEAKEKADADDAKLEQQFYAKVGIQAQKKGLKKEEPSYFMMRTLKSNLNKQNSLSNSRAKQVQQNNYTENQEQKGLATEFSKKDNLKRTLYQQPKIMKRGGYHNQSSLDPHTTNPQQQSPPHHPSPQSPQSPKIPNRLSQSLKLNKKVQESLEEQLMYEQQRIHQILMFQEHMLKKLDYFKKDVIVASQSLHLDEELDKVRLKLRAKPLNMEKVHHLSSHQGVDNLMDNTSFYRLPLISPTNKVYEGSRQLRKRKDKEKEFRSMRSQQSQAIYSSEGEKEVVRLEDRRRLQRNDKNIPYSSDQNEETPMKQDSDH